MSRVTAATTWYACFVLSPCAMISSDKSVCSGLLSRARSRKAEVLKDPEDALFPYAPACSRSSGRVKEDQSGSVDTVTPPGRERVFLCKLEHNERLFASPDKVICSMMFFSREAASRWSINVLRTSECLVTMLHNSGILLS